MRRVTGKSPESNAYVIVYEESSSKVNREKDNGSTPALSFLCRRDGRSDENTQAREGGRDYAAVQDRVDARIRAQHVVVRVRHHAQRTCASESDTECLSTDVGRTKHASDDQSEDGEHRRPGSARKRTRKKVSAIGVRGKGVPEVQGSLPVVRVRVVKGAGKGGEVAALGTCMSVQVTIRKISCSGGRRGLRTHH